jgi:hypothetical protein
MEVFVIPLGRDRYELYCETAAPIETSDATDSSTGWFARMRVRFADMVREAEDKESGDGIEEDAGLWARIQHRSLAWIAERIAEQRLLWNLRREDSAELVHPADMTFEQSLTLVKRILKRDHDRHRIWLAVHTVLFVLSGILFFVPGPNVVAYYFAFRAVGHLLSMRGAAQGLYRVAWRGVANQRLVDLRGEVLGGRGAAASVDAIARDLGLQKLAAFVERLATQ